MHAARRHTVDNYIDMHGIVYIYAYINNNNNMLGHNPKHRVFLVSKEKPTVPHDF